MGLLCAVHHDPKPSTSRPQAVHVLKPKPKRSEAERRGGGEMCRVGLCRGENCQTEPKPSGAKRSGGEGVGGGRRGLVRRACRGLFVHGACSSMGAMAGGRGSVPSRAMLGAGGAFQGAPIGGADKTGAHPKQGEHPKPKRWGFRAEAVGGASSLVVRGGAISRHPPDNGGGGGTKARKTPAKEISKIPEKKGEKNCVYQKKLVPLQCN